MSFLQITKEVAQLSATGRKKLREQLDLLEVLNDPVVMKELTEGNRQARAGRVHSREEVMAALKSAHKATKFQSA